MSHTQMENQFCNSIAVFAPLSPIANSDFDKTLDAQLQFNFAFLFLNSSGYNQTGFTFLYLSIPYHFSRHHNSGKKILILFIMIYIFSCLTILNWANRFSQIWSYWMRLFQFQAVQKSNHSFTAMFSNLRLVIGKFLQNPKSLEPDISHCEF